MGVLGKLLSLEGRNFHWFHFNKGLQFWFPALDTVRYLSTVAVSGLFRSVF